MALLLSLSGAAVSATMLLTPVAAQTEVPSGAGGQAAAVSDMVAGILAYTRWPAQNGPVTLCVAGASPMTARLTGRSLVNGRTMIVQRVVPAGSSYAGCDAIFLANSVAIAERQRAVRLATDQPIVTLYDATGGCVPGIMFCIRPATNGTMTFDLDIDAVSRSRVRIDPRVLSLGRRGAAR